MFLVYSSRLQQTTPVPYDVLSIVLVLYNVKINGVPLITIIVFRPPPPHVRLVLVVLFLPLYRGMM